jgi:hypothetical protein
MHVDRHDSFSLCDLTTTPMHAVPWAGMMAGSTVYACLLTTVACRRVLQPIDTLWQHFTEVQVSGTRSWSWAMDHGHVIAMHAMYALLARDIADLAELSLRCHQTIIAKNG